MIGQYLVHVPLTQISSICMVIQKDRTNKVNGEKGITGG